MIKAGSAVLPILFLLLGTALPAASDTVYILPELADDSGTASLEDFVTTAGGGRGPFKIPEGALRVDFSEISFFSRSYIEDKLISYAVRPVVFVGEGTVYFPKRYTEPRIRAALRALVERELGKVGEPYDRIELVPRQPLDDLERNLASGGSGRGSDMTVRGYYLQAWARNSLESGQEITALDLTVREVPEAKKGYGSISSKEILSGYVASRRIAEGERLTRYNTRKRIDVKAGEEITVIAARGAIEIKLSAVAGESGRIGEVIGVKPRNGEKSIRARIVNTREAVIEGL